MQSGKEGLIMQIQNVWFGKNSVVGKGMLFVGIILLSNKRLPPHEMNEIGWLASLLEERA